MCQEIYDQMYHKSWVSAAVSMNELYLLSVCTGEIHKILLDAWKFQTMTLKSSC